MWALRRASTQLNVKTEIASCYVENYNAGIIDSQGKVLDALLYSRRFYNKSSPSGSCTEIRPFSSQAGARSRGEQDDALKVVLSRDDDGELVSDDDDDELGSLDTETDVGKTVAPSAMAKAILANPSLPISKVLDEWVQEGNEVTQEEVSMTIRHLRKWRMYVKALSLSDWLESAKQLELTEIHYASRVDLIAMVSSGQKTISIRSPNLFRGLRAYNSLLANCVNAKDTKNSEEQFNKMKNLFPLGPFSCEQMLLLYKRTNRKKIFGVLAFMERKNIEPSRVAYKILIDVKGQYGDISGVEQIVETMKSKGVEPDTRVQASLARCYASAGLKDKAEAVLKAMEGDDITEKRWVCRYLLPIYASLGSNDEVESMRT